MDFRQLQALIAIADHGSFSAAASSLHTVQSNISSHVARLEKELGVQLVDRQGSRLTEEGQAVVERGRRVAAELEAAVADVAALRHEVVGTARIGMIGTTARWLGPRLLDGMSHAHPRVRLVIGDGTSATLQPHLASGSLDAAVVNLPQSSPDLIEQPLFEEDLVLVVPTGHPIAEKPEIALTDLDDFELLLPAPGTVFRAEIDDACRVAGVNLRARAEVDGVRLMTSLALQGYGPAILPASGVGDGLTGFTRVSVSGLPRRRVGVVLRRRGRPSAPARALLETLEAVVTASLDPRRGVHAPSA